MLTTILLLNFSFIIAISSLTHTVIHHFLPTSNTLSAYSPLLLTLSCLEHFFSPRLPHLYRMLWEQKAVTCQINIRGKKWARLCGGTALKKLPANITLEAPPRLMCAHREQ